MKGRTLAYGVPFVLAYGLPFVLMLALWQSWISFAHVPAIVAPSPFAVAAEFVARPELYLTEGAVTCAVALAGLALGMTLAGAAAVLSWFSPFATGAIAAPALLVQSTPIVALLPVLARLLGYDQRTVVASAVLITVFPTFVLVAAGLRAAPPGAADVFRALGGGPLARLRLLAIPAAIPSALVALRLAAANCFLAALTAEYLMGTSGLGRLFANASGALDTASAWAAALTATALSVAAYVGARRIESGLGESFR